MQNVTFSKTNVLLRQMVKRLSQKQAVIWTHLTGIHKAGELSKK